MLSRDQALHFYRQMLKIRLFEEQVNQLYLAAKMPGLAHLYIGQEAVVVGDGVTVPVHIRFNDLELEHRPSSADPSFAESWRSDPDEAFLERAIDRWRRQTR